MPWHLRSAGCRIFGRLDSGATGRIAILHGDAGPFRPTRSPAIRSGQRNEADLEIQSGAARRSSWSASSIAGYVSNKVLQENAREEILQNARLMMEAALSSRTYTNTQIKPLLETQLKYVFLPQTVPAYAATEQFNDLRKKHTRLRVQGGDAQSDQPARPRERLGSRRRPDLPQHADDHRGDRRARHADRPLALPRAADPDQERARASTATARSRPRPRRCSTSTATPTASAGR